MAVIPLLTGLIGRTVERRLPRLHWLAGAAIAFAGEAALITSTKGQALSGVATLSSILGDVLVFGSCVSVAVSFVAGAPDRTYRVMGRDVQDDFPCERHTCSVRGDRSGPDRMSETLGLELHGLAASRCRGRYRRLGGVVLGTSQRGCHPCLRPSVLSAGSLARFCLGSARRAPDRVDGVHGGHHPRRHRAHQAAHTERGEASTRLAVFSEISFSDMGASAILFTRRGAGDTLALLPR
jgi:hypothetical protein